MLLEGKEWKVSFPALLNSWSIKLCSVLNNRCLKGQMKNHSQVLHFGVLADLSYQLQAILKFTSNQEQEWSVV